MVNKYKVTEDNSAPLGLRKGEVRTYAPPPGLTDDEISAWVDEQMEMDDEEDINAA